MTSKILSKLNSYSSLLSSNETFNGIVEDVTLYESITVTIYSDVSSALNGIKIYLGSSSTTLILKNQYTYNAGENKTLSINATDRYFKLVYVNGSSNQTTFNLQTFYSGQKIINEPIVTTFDNTLIDLFGNLKVSNAYTLLDIIHVYDKNPLMMDELISGTPTATSVYTNASVLMSVGANTDKVIRQSRIYTPYQPGKSLCIRMTGILNANSNANNTTSRLGYFDKNNGLFFEYADGVYNIVKRNATTEIRIARSDWDDSLDGTGPSRINIDLTKNVIHYIEFAYLGVGHVRMGLIFNGKLYIAYTFQNTDLTYPYMITPNLPIRWELSSSGGAGKLICTCGSVQSEGGYSLIGNPFSYGMTTSFSVDSTTTSMQYVMSIRLKANERKTVKFISLSIICTSASNAIYSLYKVKSPSTVPISVNTPTPPITPTPPPVTFTSITNSSVQYHYNSSTGTGTPISNYLFDSSNAELLYRNYFTSSDSLNLSNLTNIGGPIYLSAGIDDSAFHSDYIVLTVQQITNQDETYYGAMNWIEV